MQWFLPARLTDVGRKHCLFLLGLGVWGRARLLDDVAGLEAGAADGKPVLKLNDLDAAHPDIDRPRMPWAVRAVTVRATRTTLKVVAW